MFRSPQKRASEHIAIARRNSPLQNAASGQACSAVIRNDQFLIPPEIPPFACSSGFWSSLFGGVPTVRPSVRVRPGLLGHRFSLRRLGLRSCVRVSGCFWANRLPEPTEEPGTNVDHSGSVATVIPCGYSRLDCIWQGS